MPTHARTRSGRRRVHSTFGSRTDVGCVREHNEDSLTVQPPLFAVADGMGGHAAGEVASEIAIRTVCQLAPEHPDGEALAYALKTANAEIINAANEGVGRQGMGTTMTAAMLEGERLVVAQVGDSRAYLLHKGRLQQITRDHSLMADMIEAGQLTPEEARFHPQRSMITRALGSDPNVFADTYEINVETGDRLLLCSDGLTGMLEDSQIAKTMMRTSDPQRCATVLVNEAIAAGGHDNITVIVVDVAGFAEQRRRKAVRKSRLFGIMLIVLLSCVLGGTAWAANSYLNTTAYLANNNGKVAIYTGVPGDVLGMNFSTLKETTDISVSDVQQSVASRLEEGIRVDTVEDARKLADTYREEIKQKEASKTPTANADAKKDAKSSGNASRSSASSSNTKKKQTASNGQSGGSNDRESGNSANSEGR